MRGKILILLVTYILIHYSLKKWKKVAYYNLDVKRKILKNRAFPNEELQMTTEITNKKILPLTWVELESTVPEGITIKGEYITTEKSGSSIFLKHYTIFSLLMFQRIRRRHTISFDKRGKYTFENLIVKTSDYFGFKNYEKVYLCETEVLIYPRIYPINQLIVDSKSYLGDSLVKRWIVEDPTYFSGTRPYTYREALKKIHWKASSRTGTIQVKEHQYSSDLSIIYVVNIPYSKYLVYLHDEETIERLLEVAAAYIDLTKQQGIAFGVATNSFIEGENLKGAIIPPSSNEGHFVKSFDLLAKIKIAAVQPVEKIINEITGKHPNTSVISILTPVVNEALVRCILMGKKKGFAFEITTTGEALVEHEEIYHLAKVNIIQGGLIENVEKAI